MSCKHPSLYNNMCVVCGMKVNVSKQNAPSDERGNANGKAVSGNNNGWKTAMTMSGGSVLQLSSEEAASITAFKVSNLRNTKKLALVLDLDHTLLHAIQVEGPTPSQLVATPKVIEGTTGAGSNNGMGDNVVHHLPIEEIDRLTVKHLVMKKRPFLDKFLEKASEFCQMTVYTAGTRRYAEAVAKVIDPQKRYFGNRIVSRCDVPNIRSDGNDKSLERIYPGDASMAVIIDDREDVWRGAQGNQLLLVKPFMHFDPRVSSATGGGSGVQATSSLGGDASVVAAAAAAAAAPSTLAVPAQQQHTIMSPVIALVPTKEGAENGEFNTAASDRNPRNNDTNLQNHGQQLKQNMRAGRILKMAPLYSFEQSSADDQLQRCLQVLLELHDQFYNDRRALVSQQQKPRTDKTENVHSLSNPQNGEDFAGTEGTKMSVPKLLTDMKRKVLAGCTITFSGLIPTNEENPRDHTLWRIAEMLGAQVMCLCSVNFSVFVIFKCNFYLCR
jgi:FCP1-like phosphatase family protein